MADYAHVGSDAGNAGGLAGAFATATSLVNFTTGELQTAASGVTMPTATLNTLADILAACVNTSGVGSGGTSPCAILLADAGNGSAANTIAAMLQIQAQPSVNAAALFALGAANGPFQPGLTVAPADYTLPISTLLPAASSGKLLAIDKAQHIWVYSEVSLDNATTLGLLTVYDNNGVQLFQVAPGAGGLNLVVQLAADPFGNMFALNANLTLSKFDASGNALSPAAGYALPVQPYPGSPAVPTLQLGQDYISIDPSGNVWGLNGGGSSSCFIELNNQGSVITPGGNFCGSAGNSITLAMATDGSGNAWYGGPSSISKVNPAGVLVAQGVNTNGCFRSFVPPPTLPSDPNNPPDLSAVEASEQDTAHLVYDRVNDRLWGVTLLGMGSLRADGTQVFCNATGNGLPSVPFTETSSSNLVLSNARWFGSEAVDGGGNLWFTTYSASVYATIFPVPTETVTYSSSVGAVSPAGTLLTLRDPSNGIFGLLNGSGTFTAVYNGSGLVYTGQQTGTSVYSSVYESLAVDAYGNIWVLGTTGYAGYNSSTFQPVSILEKIPGMAVPKRYQ